MSIKHTHNHLLLKDNLGYIKDNVLLDIQRNSLHIFQSKHINHSKDQMNMSIMYNNLNQYMLSNFQDKLLLEVRIFQFIN